MINRDTYTVAENDNLLEPDVLATEIIENIEAGLEGIRVIQ
jgi:hypothetical protein